jgi:hypothetical protein
MSPGAPWSASVGYSLNNLPGDFVLPVCIAVN